MSDSLTKILIREYLIRQVNKEQKIKFDFCNETCK